jgi:hypothetical protein
MGIKIIEGCIDGQTRPLLFNYVNIFVFFFFQAALVLWHTVIGFGPRILVNNLLAGNDVQGGNVNSAFDICKG